MTKLHPFLSWTLLLQKSGENEVKNTPTVTKTTAPENVFNASIYQHPHPFKKVHNKQETNKETNKQTSKQASKETNKQTNKQTNQQTSEQTNKHTHTLNMQANRFKLNLPLVVGQLCSTQSSLSSGLSGWSLHPPLVLDSETRNLHKKVRHQKKSQGSRPLSLMLYVCWWHGTQHKTVWTGLAPWCRALCQACYSVSGQFDLH